MGEQQQINYNRIAEVIECIKNNFNKQVNLDEIAKQVHLSPLHFQRLFMEWAGTTPEKFLQYISIEHAKKLLTEQQAILFESTFEMELPIAKLLHDLFVNIEEMTADQYKNGGKNLCINYSFAESQFGNLIVASTSRGVCYMAFEDDEDIALSGLKQKFPNATFQQKSDLLQQNALSIFQNDWGELSGIKLHLKGTEFQLKVWKALLKIPMGKLSTYSAIAKEIGNTNASRAVGTAIGSNPVAFLVPCHRVIQSSGNFGGYMWGNTRKTAMIGWEVARINSKL